MKYKKDAEQRKWLNLSLGSQHDAWVEYATRQGERPRTLAAKVLKEHLSNNQALQEVPLTESVSKRGVFIKLHDDEMMLLEDLAVRMRKSRSQTIIAVLRYVLAQEPQFSLDEEKALIQSNFQLSRIGSNLNQIARSINTVKDNNASYSQAKFVTLAQELSKSINTHIKKVWKVVNAGRHRVTLK